MQQFLHFLIEHWILWSLLVIILALLAWTELRSVVGGVTKLSPSQVVQLINRENALILDIRPADIFKSSGHIIGARNIAFSELENKLGKLQKFKTKPIVVVCTTGQQSLKAGMLLKQKGFEKVYNLQGGLNAWREASLPLTKMSGGSSDE